MGARLDGLEQRAAEGVTHDEQDVDPFGIDHRQHVVGIEVVDDVGQHEGVRVGEGVEGHPVRGAVHEGGSGHQPGAAVDGVVGDLGERGPLLVVVESSTTHGADEDVGLAPQHALGHTGRPTGVEDVEIIRGPRPAQRIGQGRRLRRQRVLVPFGTVEQIVARLVGDLQQDPEVREPVADLGQDGGEGGVVHDRGGVGVREQVFELLGHVAVVHVERGGPCLERPDHRLEVLVAVVQVDGHEVLTGLVTVEFVAGRSGAEATADQRVGELAGAITELSIGETAVPEDDALPIGRGGLDRFVQLGEVELHCLPCPPARGWIRYHPWVSDGRGRPARSRTPSYPSSGAHPLAVPLRGSGCG